MFAGLKCLTVAGATTVAWCLMMFCDTHIHQGSLFNPLVLSAGLALICFWLSRLLGMALLILQAGLFAVIYGPLSKPDVLWQIWRHDVDAGMCVMTILAVGAYLALLRKAPC